MLLKTNIQKSYIYIYIYTLFNNASKKQTSKNPISFAYEHTALFVIVYLASPLLPIVETLSV